MVLGQPSCGPTVTCRGISHWQAVLPLVRLTPHAPRQRSTEYHHQVPAARSVVPSDWLDLPGGEMLGFCVPSRKSLVGLSCVLLASEVFA